MTALARVQTCAARRRVRSGACLGSRVRTFARASASASAATTRLLATTVARRQPSRARRRRHSLHLHLSRARRWPLLAQTLASTRHVPSSATSPVALHRALPRAVISPAAIARAVALLERRHTRRNHKRLLLRKKKIPVALFLHVSPGGACSV